MVGEVVQVTHDPLTAAAYLAGELTTAERTEFESHLLTCDECWAELDTARRGQAPVELAREQAPPQLRQRIRAAITRRRPGPCE